MPIDERQMNPESERLSGKVVLASMVGVWLCYFLLITLRGVVVGLEFQDELLWRRALVCVVGVAMTGLLWLVLRVVENRSLGIKIAVTLVVAMPGAIVIAQANRWIFSSIEAKVEEQMGKERGIALRRDDAGNLLIDLPRTKMGEDVEQAEEAVPQSVLISPAPTSLDQWRMTFDFAIGRYFILLAWASLFLALLAGAQARAAERRGERFPERLRIKVDLPPELARYQVPGMILQPLVENSVKYGVSASRKPVTITIAAREEYGRLVLTVSDDGPGTAGEHGFGIGLANVRDRLEARFGNSATIVSGPALTGYETELRLPMVKHG